MDVSYGGIERLLRQGIVAARADLASQAVVQERLAGDLGGDGGGKSHPYQLEAISEEIEISGSNDGGDDGYICDGRGAYFVQVSWLWFFVLLIGFFLSLSKNNQGVTYGDSSRRGARRRRNGNGSTTGPWRHVDPGSCERP